MCNIGVCISSVTKHRHFYVLVGKTRSGKSVALELVGRLFVPNESCVQCISLNELGARFNAERLVNVKLNYCTEIEPDGINNTSVLKKLVSEEPMFVERKKQDGYCANPHCKLLFAANQMPTFKKLDAGGNKAVYDRMIIVKYSHSFEGKADDKKLAEKLYAERNIWCSLAVNELVELVNNGFQFTESDDSKVLYDMAQQDSRSLEMFLQEKCVFEGNVHRCDFMQAYTDFCKVNGFKAYNNNTVLQYVTVNYPNVDNAKFSINKIQRWGWKGLSLKEGKDNE